MIFRLQLLEKMLTYLVMLYAIILTVLLCRQIFSKCLLAMLEKWKEAVDKGKTCGAFTTEFIKDIGLS